MQNLKKQHLSIPIAVLTLYFRNSANTICGLPANANLFLFIAVQSLLLAKDNAPRLSPQYGITPPQMGASWITVQKSLAQQVLTNY